MGNGADLIVTEDSKQCKLKSSLHAQTRHFLGKRFVYAWKVRTHAKHQISTRLPKPCSWNPFHPANIAKVLPEIYMAHRHSTRVKSFAMENHNQRVQEVLPLDTIMDGILNPFYQIRLHGFAWICKWSTPKRATGGDGFADKFRSICDWNLFRLIVHMFAWNMREAARKP